MATHYYVTWPPDCAEPGHYFLTHIESDRADLGLGEIMDRAHEIEDVEMTQTFELCSILRVDTAAAVIH
jgi:hypothetical protein